MTADEGAYAESLGPRSNLFDRAHRGNVHQRVADHVALELRRSDLDNWWATQKFTSDRRASQSGPYLDVQWAFMDRYYSRDRVEGLRVLDFGCGPGLFSRLFASRGATVVGVDVNPAHLETAARLAAEDDLGDRTDFRSLELPAEQGLAALQLGRFDLVVLSDVLMFYFHPYGTPEELDPRALLRCLAEHLTDDGTIAVLEPNGIFWQQPQFGAPERPLLVLSEYRHRTYGVTPTLEQLSRAAEEAGLAITRVRELVPSSDEPSAATEFPLVVVLRAPVRARMILGVAQVVVNLDALEPAAPALAEAGYEEVFCEPALANHPGKRGLQAPGRETLAMTHFAAPGGGTAIELTAYEGAAPVGARRLRARARGRGSRGGPAAGRSAGL